MQGLISRSCSAYRIVLTAQFVPHQNGKVTALESCRFVMWLCTVQVTPKQNLHLRPCNTVVTSLCNWLPRWCHKKLFMLWLWNVVAMLLTSWCQSLPTILKLCHWAFATTYLNSLHSTRVVSLVCWDPSWCCSKANTVFMSGMALQHCFADAVAKLLNTLLHLCHLPVVCLLC